MSNRFRYILIIVSVVLVFYIVIGGLLGESTSTSEQTYKDLGVYSEVLSRIKSDYVTEPNLPKVTGGAIRGLLEALDPYSTYFNPQQFKEYLEHPDPGPAGTGIFVSKKFGFATVVSVLPGSPADKAGIKAADLLDRINGKPVRELSAVQIERKLAGAPGTSVEIWVVNESRGEPQKLTLSRAILTPPPVQTKMADSQTGYVHVATFNKGESAEIASAVKKLVAQGADKIVLDLRDCAGGEADEALKTASLFIQKGLITYTYGQRSARHDYMAEPEGTVFKLPVAVLINRATAGPAEIVADAILCDKRGDVVGVPSFGVGVVQKTIPVGDGSGLLLSVAKYYGPNGKAIEANGVTPNIMVPTPGEVATLNGGAFVTPQQFGTKDDIQLQKAIDVLKQQSSPAKAA
ncbi:MAG TPA: S41 family peptidase [Terriglobia bacterium]|nr:S41 family peptidase [Terriglobia bacterium]